MARFARLDVLNRLASEALVPVFYHPDPEIARKVIGACASGGVTVVEFTNRGDHAIDVFKQLVVHCAREFPNVILGVGSIVDAPTAALFIAHGAHFVVGPSFNREVALLCNRRKIAYLPGCGTITEIQTAEELGVEVVKLFPCDTIGGPAFLKALMGPCPWTRVMPTGIGKVSRETVTAWIQAGAVAIGVGRELIVKEALDSGDFSIITRKASEILGWIREARTR